MHIPIYNNYCEPEMQAETIDLNFLTISNTLGKGYASKLNYLDT